MLQWFIYYIYTYLVSLNTTFAYSEVFPSLPGYIKPAEIEVQKCEMKISPATLINKKWHSDFRPPNVNERSQATIQPGRCCHSHSDCWGVGGMQEARWTRKQDWPQTAEVHVKGMNSVSPEACIFPYIEC